MTPFYDITPLVVAQVPQVPDPVAAQCLLLTARELCRETSCWRYETAGNLVVAGDPIVSFYDLPMDSQIIAADEVTLGGIALGKVSLDQLSRRSVSWTTDVGPPRLYYLGPEKNQLRVVSIPDADGELYACLVLEPTLNANGLDPLVLDRHLDTLIDGALSRLLRYPDRPWTNFGLARVYADRVEQAKRVIRSQAADGFQSGVFRSVRYGGY